jgi:hypothetical protein
MSCHRSRKEAKIQILCIETQRMWKMKCNIIPVTGAIRILTKGLRKNLEATPEKRLIDSLQKTAWNIIHTTESTAG